MSRRGRAIGDPCARWSPTALLPGRIRRSGRPEAIEAHLACLPDLGLSGVRSPPGTEWVDTGATIAKDVNSGDLGYDEITPEEAAIMSAP
jgi:hypothetical protein